MFAIQNIKTGKFVYGTDYRCWPPHQRTSKKAMQCYKNLYFAKSDFLERKCGKDYKIVELEPVVVKRIIEPPKSFDEISMSDCDESE